MNEITIKTDKDRNILAIEGIPAGFKVKVLRKREPGPAEIPKLQWFAVFWHVVCGKTLVKCFNEQEARRFATTERDESRGNLVRFEEGRMLRHETYEPIDEDPYISGIDQDEDTLQEGAELEKGADQ